MLLLGRAGATDLVEGRARRTIDAGSRSPRELFLVLARELCASRVVEWRRRFVEGKQVFELDDTRVSYDDRTVSVDVEIPRDVVRLFSRPTGSTER